MKKYIVYNTLLCFNHNVFNLFSNFLCCQRSHIKFQFWKKNIIKVFKCYSFLTWVNVTRNQTWRLDKCPGKICLRMEASLILDGLGKVEKSHWMFTNYHLLSSIILVFDYHESKMKAKGKQGYVCSTSYSLHLNQEQTPSF